MKRTVVACARCMAPVPADEATSVWVGRVFRVTEQGDRERQEHVKLFCAPCGEVVWGYAAPAVFWARMGKPAEEQDASEDAPATALHGR